MNKNLLLTLFFGIFIGSLIGVIVSKFFPISPYFREKLPYTTLVFIFLGNSFLATLICYGGILFSLAELKVYKFSIYKFLDSVFNPLYIFLGKISKDIGKLKPMYRSCYLSLFYFPLGCIFLFATIVSMYFSMFLMVLGFSVLPKLLKFLPHLTLETLAFFSAASIGLEFGNKISKFLFERKVEEFDISSRRILKDKNIWKKLLIIYSILLLSAFVEKFFVELF